MNLKLFLLVAIVVLRFSNVFAIPDGYHLSWADEFEGNSINSSKWSWGSLPWGGQHHTDDYASYITPEDSYLSNGSLILRSRNGSFGGFPYSEGFVHSNGKYRFLYGYVEIRAKYPTGRGLWPAFWMLSDGWPPEFDIAEYFGSDNRMHSGVAYGTCCPASWNSSNFYEDVANWHTYGLEWGEGFAKWYKDGVVKKTVSASYIPSVSMYIILNSGVRWDADSSTSFPNYFEVDYVRVFTPGDSTPPFISSITSRTISINGNTGPIQFFIGDNETSPNLLLLSATSSNPTLVPQGNIIFGGSGTNRTVTVTPISQQSGSSTITIYVSDGQYTSSESFTLTVSGTNNAPTISAIPDVTMSVNRTSGLKQFTINDRESLPDNLIITATSSNPDLLLPENIIFSGNGTNRYFLIKPSKDNYGFGFIDITVSDGELSSRASFMVTVTNPSNIIINGGFENGIINWTTVFGGSPTTVTSPIHQGRRAGILKSRTDWYYGLGQSIKESITNEMTYRCSTWVRLQGTTNDNAYITARQTDENGTIYYRIVNGQASSSQWTYLSGNFTPTFGSNLTELTIYVEGPAAGVDILVDDVEVVPYQDWVLIPRGSIWKYVDTGVRPAMNWFVPGLYDGNWKSGPAQLGYGDGDEATIVGYGQSTNKYITTWFRNNFYVQNPYVFTGLVCSLLRDDGAVIYLNGYEVFRSNMPAGLITPSTLALASISGDEETTRYVKTNLPLNLLKIGTNTIAVEVHQASTTSTDLSFDLELVGILRNPYKTIVSAGSIWKYNDYGINYGSDWRYMDFDDSLWKSGYAQLGYGNSTEATIIDYGANSSQKYITYYFRTSFILETPEEFLQWIVRLLRDDGAVVYLNGVEIFRSNMPNGDVFYNTFATKAASDDGTVWYSTNVPASLFVRGTNILAVEVHQNSQTSTDLVFDLELIGFTKESLPSLQVNRNDDKILLNWDGWATGFMPQFTTNISKIPQWYGITNASVLSNNLFNLVAPFGNLKNGYFRLIKNF